MSNSVPNIREDYKDYGPPVNVKRTIENLLSYVPPEDLGGLEEIVLTNVTALPRRDRRRKGNTGGLPANRLGHYCSKSNNRKANIVIFVDNVLKKYAPWSLKVPFLKNHLFAEVVFHEIGHHVQATSGVDLKRISVSGEEAFADRYAEKIRKIFIGKHYWYLKRFPVLLRIYGWLLKKIESLYIWYQSRKENAEMSPT